MEYRLPSLASNRFTYILKTITTATLPPQEERKLYPYPSGWYLVTTSADLANDEIKPITFCGKEVIVYRTKSGKAHVSDAYCPHMGAHLGHGGKVMGEELFCPFHGFKFDAQGCCTETGYGTKAPPKAKLRMYSVLEVNRMVLAYHDQMEQAPEWSIPDLNLEQYGPLKMTSWNLKSHPQETTENSVDVGHFSWIHGYDKIVEDLGAETDGTLMKAKYSFSRNGKEFGKKGEIRVNIEVNVYGLGFSVVDVQVPEVGIHSKNFVLPTPVKDGQIKLTIGMAMKPIEDAALLHPLAVLVPKSILDPIILSLGMKGYKKDVMDDFDIWQNKIYIEKPALAKGDGPIALYRKWAKQFYVNQFI